MSSDLGNPEYYINREFTALSFNERVLQLAKDERVPLLERMRFLCICSGNLDEFFEIRVAGLKEKLPFIQENITSMDFKRMKFLGNLARKFIYLRMNCMKSSIKNCYQQ